MKLSSVLFAILIIVSPVILHAQKPYRIALLGCHRQFEPAPALVRYVEAEPDLCIWVGDNIYADTQTDPGHLQACYDALAAKPAFQQLMELAPYLATWDDHDFGDNNEWKDYPLKEQSREMFRAFWHLEDKIPADREGVFYSEVHEVGDITMQVIMLDVRYHRDEPGEESDVLGEGQWEWLEDELDREADLRLIVSGTQVLLNKDAGSETWDQYPQARRRLFEMIRKHQAEGVLFITGDQHYGEVCRQDGGLPYDAVELQFAGINQTEAPEYNPLRVVKAATSLHSYAIIDLYPEPSDSDIPHLLFRVMDAQTNLPEFEYRLNLSDLQVQLNVSKDTVFATSHEVILRHRYPDLDIRYTTDGSDPMATSMIYEKPVHITESTMISARLFDAAGIPVSRVFKQRYEQLEEWSAVSKPELSSGLRFEYIEGMFEQLPDFTAADPGQVGIAHSFDVSGFPAEDHFAVRYSGYIRIPESGLYTFHLTSDDGSALYLHGKMLVNNDGSHSRRTRSGQARLEAGLHPIEIRYFEDYSGEWLNLEVTGTQKASGEALFSWFSHK